MSKYIDMEVVADAKIDTIKQSSLKLKESGFTIAPVLSTGESTAGIRYSPSGQALDGCRLAGFGSTSGNADGNYTYDSSSGVFTLNNNKVVHENNLWSIYIGSTVVWKSNNDADWPWDVSGWTLQVGGGDTGNVTAIYGDPTPAKWEYSNGSGYAEFGSGGGLTGEEIEFSESDLSDGVLTIQHNLGNKYPFGLDYNVMPKDVRFVDSNTLQLDYSDRPANGADGTIILTGAGTVAVNGTYVKLYESEFPNLTSSGAKVVAAWQSATHWLVGYHEGNDTTTILFWIVPIGWTGATAPLYASSGDYTTANPLIVTWTKNSGANPVPSISPGSIGKVWFVGSRQDMLKQAVR